MVNIMDYFIGDKVKVKAISNKEFIGIIIDFKYKDEYPEDGIIIETSDGDIFGFYLSEIKEISVLPKKK